MKRLIELLGIVVCVILLHSCTTSQEITVQGTPGTEIYSPRMERLGVIGSNAQVSFKISSDDYFSYLMSRDAGSNQLVPFALDYKKHSYTGTQVLKYLGYGINAAGALSCLVSVLTCINGDFEEVGTPFFAGGGAAVLLGTAIGMPAEARSNQTQYKYKYKYLSIQNTNQDFRFAPIVDLGDKKTLQNDGVSETVATTINHNDSATSSTAARKKSSVSRRTLNDNAKLVSGTYSGTGYLAQKDKIIEKYSNVKVVVSRIDNNTVNVDVIENGESYFSTKSKYQVKKKGKNTFVLSLNGIPDAFIKIDNAGHLTYIHPRVNIDGEIYTLNITATKK